MNSGLVIPDNVEVHFENSKIYFLLPEFLLPITVTIFEAKKTGEL